VYVVTEVRILRVVHFGSRRYRGGGRAEVGTRRRFARWVLKTGLFKYIL
jgi:hypothetical protein